MKSCVLLLSGGMDSVNAMHMLLKENTIVYPIFIDYGQKALIKEMDSAKYFSKIYKTYPLKVLKTNSYDKISNHPLLSITDNIVLEEDSTSANYLHFRNLTFACLAAIYAKEVKAECIAFGFIHKNSFNSFPDTSPHFVSKLNELFKLIEPNSSLSIITPGISMSKKEIVQYGIDWKIPINNTYSCYENERCYKCESCLEVINAFKALSTELDEKDFLKYNPYKTTK